MKIINNKKYILRTLFTIVISLFILTVFAYHKSIQQEPIKKSENDSLVDFKKKIYKIGIPNIPGLMYFDNKGNPHGFPVELINYMLTENNIKFIWVSGSWSELLNKILKGEIDFLPSTQITEERKKKIDFISTNLYTQWSELYIHKSSNFKDISDLYGQKIALVKDDNNAKGFINYFTKFRIEYIPVQFDTHKAAFEALRNKAVFAVAAPSPNNIGINLDNIKSAGIFYNPVDVSISTSKGKNKELAKLLSKRLLELKNTPNSIYYQLLKKYDFTNYRDKKWKFPLWVIYSFLIGIAAIALALIFISLLKKEVNRKTKELTERGNLLNEAMNIGEIGAWSYNYKKKKLLWSDEIYTMAGIKSKYKNLSLSILQKFIHPEDIDKVILSEKETQSKQKKFETEYRIIKENKDILFVKQIGMIKKTESGKLVKFYGLIQNISKQKEYEQKLIHAKEKAERSEKLKSAFLANMSHEIRTPLNAITGFSSILAKEDLSQKDKTKFTDIIQKQNDVLLRLINDILDLSKIESGNMEIHQKSINPYKLIDEIHENFKHQCPAEINLTKNYSKDTKVNITTDYIRLNQILSNFVSNALKYTKSGNVEIACKILNNKNQIKIYVKDTGIGMSEKEKQKVFTPFVQVDSMKQGTGLGLSIAKSLADLLHIEIGFESKEKIGSEFFVLLPLDTTIANI